MFSLGCIAYELLTGQRPFAGNALAAEKRAAPLPPTAGFDPALQRAISSALRYRRDDRPSDANQFLELWCRPAAPSALPAARSLGATAVWGMLIVAGVIGGIGVRRALSPAETQRDSIATTALENQQKDDGAPIPELEANPLPPAARAELVEADVEALLAANELTLDSEQAEELAHDNEPALEYAGNAEYALRRDLAPKHEPEHQREPEPARETGGAGRESDPELGIEPPVAAVIITDTAEPFAVPEPHLSGQSYWLATVKRAPPQPLEAADLVQLIDPHYPKIAKRAGIEGWVDVDFAVAPTGQPVGIEIVGAKPPGVFERSAVEAVMSWRFAQSAGARHVYARVRFER